MKKLWKVAIERVLMVMADDEDAAERIALQYEGQERWNDPESIITTHVTDPKQVPSILLGEIPFHAPADRTCEFYASSPTTSSGPTTDR